LKRQVRVLGIDDSPFAFDSDTVLVVGAVVRAPSYLEGIMVTECEVDGTDANEALELMISRSRFREQLKLIIIDGVALGGFNVVDISRLSASLCIPFATITRDPPDMTKIEKALKSHFADWEERLEVIIHHPLKAIPASHKPIHAAVSGMEFEEAARVIRECTIRGSIPEPVRIAHTVASGIVRGESKGRA